MLLDEVLKSVTGDDGYPGDSTASENWPGVAPGHARDPQRALGQVLQLGRDRRPRPQAADPVDPRHARTSSSPTARRGRWARSGSLGAVPGWPGEDVFPPQPMVAQIRAVLERYRGARRPRRDRDVRGLRPLPADRRGGALERAVLRRSSRPSNRSRCAAVAVSARCSPPRRRSRGGGVRWVEPGRRRRRRLPLCRWSSSCCCWPPAARSRTCSTSATSSTRSCATRRCASRPRGSSASRRRCTAELDADAQLEVLGAALRGRLPGGRRRRRPCAASPSARSARRRTAA